MRGVPDFEETGELTEITVTHWWCPSQQRWVMCDEPCPDGTPHTEKRTYKTMAHIMRRVDDA